MSDSLWPLGPQHIRLPCLFIVFWSLFRFTSIESVMLLTISSSTCCAQLLSCVWLFVTPWTVACQSPLGILQARELGLQFALLPSHPLWGTDKPHLWRTRALLLEELVLQKCFPVLCPLSSYVVSKVEFSVLFLAWATVLFISWMRKWMRKIKKKTGLRNPEKHRLI